MPDAARHTPLVLPDRYTRKEQTSLPSLSPNMRGCVRAFSPQAAMHRCVSHPFAFAKRHLPCYGGGDSAREQVSVVFRVRSNQRGSGVNKHVATHQARAAVVSEACCHPTTVDDINGRHGKIFYAHVRLHRLSMFPMPIPEDRFQQEEGMAGVCAPSRRCGEPCNCSDEKE